VAGPRSQALKNAFHTEVSVLKGPHCSAMDTVVIDVPDAGALVSFDGHQMRWVGVLHIPGPNALGAGRAPYSEDPIERTSPSVFSAGKLVYELGASQGQVYLMQTFAQIVDPTLTEEQLATLAACLQPPEGWQYRAHRFDQHATLNTDGVAHRLQDALQNTYQRLDRQEIKPR
jgi:hypothetical protein